MSEDLKTLAYPSLWHIISSNKEDKALASKEVRWRRRNNAIPKVLAHKDYELTENQAEVYKILLEELGISVDKPDDKILVDTVSYKVKGGWVVYLTGEDRKLIREKAVGIKELVYKDAEEFGTCRVFVAAVKGDDWDGLLVRFDRGLRLAYE